MSDFLATTFVPLDGALGNSEVGVLLDAPAAEAVEVEDLCLTPDEWLALRLARAEHHRHDAAPARAHVDQAQGIEGRACDRCRHAAHAAARKAVAA